MTDKIRYESGTADITQLRAVSDAEWKNALSGPEVRKSLQEAGINVNDLPGAGTFEVRTGSSGFDVSGADIIIAVGGWATGVLGDTAKEILLDLWRTHVKPRIADRLGDDAVGSKKD